MQTENNFLTHSVLNDHSLRSRAFLFSGKGPSVHLITLPMTRTFFDFPRSSGYLIGSRSGVDCIRLRVGARDGYRARFVIATPALWCSQLCKKLCILSFGKRFGFFSLSKLKNPGRTEFWKPSIFTVSTISNEIEAVHFKGLLSNQDADLASDCKATAWVHRRVLCCCFDH